MSNSNSSRTGSTFKNFFSKKKSKIDHPQVKYERLRESPSPPPQIPQKNQPPPELPPRNHTIHKNLIDLGK